MNWPYCGWLLNACKVTVVFVAETKDLHSVFVSGGCKLGGAGCIPEDAARPSFVQAEMPDASFAFAPNGQCLFLILVQIDAERSLVRLWIHDPFTNFNLSFCGAHFN